MASPPEDAGVASEERIVDAVREHTHALLGSTITYTESDWAGASRLAGWTRSHVAAHLAENARGFLRVVAGAWSGRAVRMYGSDAERARDIEVGALADGLALQIDLDTSAGQLQDVLGRLIGDDTPLQLRAGHVIPARQVAVARLHEVVLHCFDLHPEADALDVGTDVGVALLEFTTARLGGRPDLPAMELRSDDGFRARIGADGPPRLVTGPACDLVAWLARNVISARLTGAISLP